jgi:hypothetical protein
MSKPTAQDDHSTSTGSGLNFEKKQGERYAKKTAKSTQDRPSSGRQSMTVKTPKGMS